MSSFGDEDKDFIFEYGVEVYINRADLFNVIRETLERIGIAASDKNVLSPTCVLLHKRGRYFILHYKEMFLLDKKNATISLDDLARRNKIVDLLKEWNLLTVSECGLEKMKSNQMEDTKSLTIIPFKEKKNWHINCKYHVGSNLKNANSECRNI